MSAPRLSNSVRKAGSPASSIKGGGYLSQGGKKPLEFKGGQGGLILRSPQIKEISAARIPSKNGGRKRGTNRKVSYIGLRKKTSVKNDPGATHQESYIVYKRN